MRAVSGLSSSRADSAGAGNISRASAASTGQTRTPVGAWEDPLGAELVVGDGHHSSPQWARKVAGETIRSRWRWRPSSPRSSRSTSALARTR